MLAQRLGSPVRSRFAEWKVPRRLLKSPRKVRIPGRRDPVAGACRILSGRGIRAQRTAASGGGSRARNANSSTGSGGLNVLGSRRASGCTDGSCALGLQPPESRCGPAPFGSAVTYGFPRRRFRVLGGICLVSLYRSEGCAVPVRARARRNTRSLLAIFDPCPSRASRRIGIAIDGDYAPLALSVRSSTASPPTSCRNAREAWERVRRAG